MSRLLKIGNSIFAVLMCLWLYYSIYFMFDYFQIDFLNPSSNILKMLLCLLILLFVLFHYRNRIFKNFYLVGDWLNSNRIFVFLGVVLFQILVTLSSLRLALADTSVVYQLATDVEFASYSEYISIYPNNFVLVLWFKINYWIFGENLLLVLAIWNITFIDLSIYLLSKLNTEVISKKVGDYTFWLMIFILALSPQYIYTYSDSITLFFLTLSLFLLFRHSSKNSMLYLISSGFLFGIAYALRPTVFIFAIAGFITVLNLFLKNKISIKQCLRKFITFIVSFILVLCSLNIVLEKQTIVNYEKNQSRTLLYYIDLGLTYSGNIHSDIPIEVTEAKGGGGRNKEAIKDIKRRINEYTLTSFLGHVFYKYYWITNEGGFGWIQENVIREDGAQKVNWLKKGSLSTVVG